MGKNHENKKNVEFVPDKKTKNQIKNTKEEPEYDSYSDISNTVSSGECTGLMFAPPQNQEELESYQELSNMQIPKNKEKDKQRPNSSKNQ